MTVTYSFETSTMTNKNGEKKRESKSIVDGDQGVMIKFLKKDDKNFKRVKASERDGKITVTTKIGEEEHVEELDEKEFLKMAKADKDLDFVIDYMKNRQRGGGVRRRRVVKKTSKKMSKKMSKKKSAW